MPYALRRCSSAQETSAGLCSCSKPVSDAFGLSLTPLQAFVHILVLQRIVSVQIRRLVALRPLIHHIPEQPIDPAAKDEHWTRTDLIDQAAQILVLPCGASQLQKHCHLWRATHWHSVQESHQACLRSATVWWVAGRGQPPRTSRHYQWADS